ncbi:MAG: lysophospholipase [Chitinophagales bacterium]
MKHTAFNWYGPDGQLVFAQTWQPDNNFKLRGVICLIHGLGEHSGRYEQFANFFIKKDFAVIACDLRGHGQSEGKRGHVSAFHLLLNQIDKLLEEASKKFRSIPRFVYGHSMGGNVVINHALTHNPRIKGVIVSAPWLRTVAAIPSSKLLVAKIANIVWGSYTESNGLDLTQLSRDPQVAKDYEADPLVHDKISASLFSQGTQHANESMAIADQLDIPMLLMHGTKDGITDHTASVEFAQKAPKYVTFKEWKGLYHELHNEPEKNEVLEYVLTWIDKRLATLK